MRARLTPALRGAVVAADWSGDGEWRSAVRMSLAGAVVLAVFVAFLAAVVVGVGNQPLPTEAELTLVELGQDGDGQPRVEVRDGASRSLSDLVGDAPTAVVAHDQLICVGGSLVDAGPGDPVSVTGIVDVRVGPPATIIADRVIIECGDG